MAFHKTKSADSRRTYTRRRRQGKKLIHETIEKLAEDGVSIILLSSDLPELVALSDRVVVMKQGHLIGELRKADGFDETKVLLAANGERSVFSAEY